jgi:DNA-binding transcriptional regulator YhcF (GntR family)/DNA-binding LacI/PurR family transcriptional regulator
MNRDFSTLVVEKRLPAWEQVYTLVKQRLVSDQWPPGTRLPATNMLARQLQTHDRAVHKAMQALVKEGFLERRRPAGTFVRERVPLLARVGLYYGGSLSQPDHHFTRAVHEALRTELRQKGQTGKIWVDERPEDEWASPLPDLAAAARDRAVDAVVAPLVDARTVGWLAKLPLPVAVCGSGLLPNRVTSDFDQFVSLSLDGLQRQGCRSVGLIAPMSPASEEPGGRPHQYAEFFVRFVDTARDRGLELRTEWIVAPAHPDELRDRGLSHERYGYESGRRILGLSTRPAGLVVYDDVVARGVVTALLEQRVHVPDDLKLVLHKNEEVDLVCPFPAAFVVTRARDVALALIGMVERQFRGESVEPVYIGCRLEMP